MIREKLLPSAVRAKALCQPIQVELAFGFADSKSSGTIESRLLADASNSISIMVETLFENVLNRSHLRAQDGHSPCRSLPELPTDLGETK